MAPKETVEKIEALGIRIGVASTGDGDDYISLTDIARYKSDEPMKAEIILYQSEGVNVPVPVRFQSDTFWLTQQQIADLFLKDKSTISRHLKNIFDDGELQEESVVAAFATTASDGKVYQVSYYNLDAVISVGYRVNSVQATRFRQWATTTLREYITKHNPDFKPVEFDAFRRQAGLRSAWEVELVTRGTMPERGWSQPL